MKRCLLSLAPLLFAVGCAQSSGGGGSQGGQRASAMSERPRGPAPQQTVQPPRAQEPPPVRLIGVSDQSPSPRENRPNRDDTATAVENDDYFIRQASMANLAEIELSQVALRNSNNPDVRSLAQAIIQHHTQAQSDLRSVCYRLGMKMTEEPDARHQNMVSRLSRLRGIQFDREYVNSMVGDHDDAIAKFTVYSDEGYYREVRNFAATNLSMLREHWRTAKDLQQSLQTLR